MRTLIAIVGLVVFVACSGTEQSTSSNSSTSATQDSMLIRAKESAEAALLRNSPQFQQADANVQAQIAKRGPLSFAFVNAPLPNGAIAIIRVNQAGPRTAYVIARESSFDSRVYVRSQAARVWFDIQRGDNDSPAEITLFEDGRVTAVSQDLGQFTHEIKETSDQPDSSGVGGRLLKQMKKATAADIPGFGAARIIDPK